MSPVQNVTYLSGRASSKSIQYGSHDLKSPKGLLPCRHCIATDLNLRANQGRPIVMLLNEGQMSDHKGARLVLNAMPPAKTLIADRGYDSTPFRDALQEKGIES